MNKIKLKNPGYLAPLFLAMGLVGMFLYKWLFAYVEDPVSGCCPPSPCRRFCCGC